MKESSLFIPILIALIACESTADVDLPEAVPTLTVDAFINNKPENQHIVLSFSQDFLNNDIYQPAEGAVVTVTDDDGNPPLVFSESETPGVYVWESTSDRPIIGNDSTSYTLAIDYQGNEFLSVSEMTRTTTVDSILFFEENEPFSDDIIFEGRIISRDPIGVGDAYWIKTFWNGNFLSRPSEINIAFDAGLNPGAAIDGQEFIIPIKVGINPQDDDESYTIGDMVKVEIHSLTEEAFNYLLELQIQTDRPGGFGELFSVPLANLSTNILAENNPEVAVLGFFSVSSVSSLEVEFTEDLIREL